MTPIVWFIAAVGALLLLIGTAAVAGFSAAPYLPTRWRDVARALDLAEVGSGDVVYDLGCGDGRFVVAAARRGARAEGYEISLVPYLWSRLRVAMAPASGISGSARIHYRSFYSVNLADADVVVCFLTPTAMRRLSTKVVRELKPGARLLSVAFHLPGFTPVVSDHQEHSAARIFLYRRDPS